MSDVLNPQQLLDEGYIYLGDLHCYEHDRPAIKCATLGMDVGRFGFSNCEWGTA